MISPVRVQNKSVRMEGEMLKLTGWTRKVTGHGVVYYVRRGTSETRYLALSVEAGTDNSWLI